MNNENAARAIAFYLPQYHPIPENNAWWGEGFTEWTNVRKAKPLFRGHYQPHIPADLGYYDLRMPEARAAQAALARAYGIEGFCYWRYWFAGKQLLQRPFKEVLASGQPEFPFCLAWANETWTGIWHGEPGRILIEQTYPGFEDYTNHFVDVLPAFLDKRYLCIQGKPIFIIYNLKPFEAINEFIKCWRGLAKEHNLPGIYFIGMGFPGLNYENIDLDGIINNSFFSTLEKLKRLQTSLTQKITQKLRGKIPYRVYSRFPRYLRIFDYKEYIEAGFDDLQTGKDLFPLIYPNWDNTPRSGPNGVVLHESSPKLFASQVALAIDKIRSHEKDKQIIFIKSWNEWAEGNYLEPDQRFGLAYLEIIKHLLSQNRVVDG